MVIDFGDFKRILREILDELDHMCINDVAPFDEINPTSENLAKWLFDRMKSRVADLPNLSISKVTVEESEGVTASYWE
jgi:6-pyruvoyltetrahydropterin/6-carboxytetrahydropterin synthase